MPSKLFSTLLIVFLLLGSGCKVIYANRVPVVKPKKHYSWFKPQFKHRKRTKIVWMKVHKGKFKDARPAPTPPAEGPVDEF
jgi:hypothetical protein